MKQKGDHHFPALSKAGLGRFVFFQRKRHPRIVPDKLQVRSLVKIQPDFTPLPARRTALPETSRKSDRTFSIRSHGHNLLWSPEYAVLLKKNCLEAGTGPDVPFGAARNLRPAFPYNQMALVTRQCGGEPIDFLHGNGSFN